MVSLFTYRDKRKIVKTNVGNEIQKKKKRNKPLEEETRLTKKKKSRKVVSRTVIEFVLTTSITSGSRRPGSLGFSPHETND